MTRLVKIILFEESRKTAYALWVTALATGLLSVGVIEAVHWVTTVGTCAALVSGGAVWEKYLETKNGAHPMGD